MLFGVVAKGIYSMANIKKSISIFVTRACSLEMWRLTIVSVGFLLSFVFSSIPMNAEIVKGDVSVGNFWYWLGTVSNPYASVGCLNSNAMGHYEIPETIDVNGAKFTVNSIHSLAFMGQTYMMKSLTIPESIDEIGDAAFWNSSKSGLDSLIIKDSPKKLDCTRASTVNSEYLGQFSRTSIKYLYLGRDLDFTPYSLHYRHYNPFMGVNTFETIELGENVTNFDSFFYLSDSENLKKIILHSMTPPTCDETQFTKLQLLTVEIEVPEGALSNYKSVKPWSEFLNVKESKDKTFVVVGKYDENKGSVYVNRLYLNGQQSFNKGDELELVFLPSKGYYVESVLINGVEMVSELINNSLQLQKVVEDVNVEVNFSLPKMNVKLAVGDGGSYLIPVEYGKSLTIGLSPNNGWCLQTVYVDGNDLTTSVVDGNLELKSIEKNTEISAVFFLASGVQNIEKPQPRVRIVGNAISVDNVDDVGKIEYYDMKGTLLARGTKTFRINNKGGYIIKYGQIKFKVLI